MKALRALVGTAHHSRGAARQPMISSQRGERPPPRRNLANGQLPVNVAGHVAEAVRPFGENVDGVMLVLPPAPDAGILYGVTDPDDLARMAEQLTAHPWKCARSVDLMNMAALWTIPQDHIACTSTLATRDKDLIAEVRAARRLWGIDTWHDLMITGPEK